MEAQVLDVLQQCSVSDNIIKLPQGQLDRKLYEGVKKSLEGIGGKWKGGKTQGFVFPYSPVERLAQLQGGAKINLKKEYQFFATPAAVADRLCTNFYISPEAKILEPSAGQGAIVEAIMRNNKISADNIDCCELMDLNRDILQAKGFRVIAHDFLTLDRYEYYDYIIANPPFANHQDTEHIMWMYRSLKPGGRLISIASPHWTFASDAKSERFRTWLSVHDGGWSHLEEGSFKESGTMVKSVIVYMNKSRV